MIFDALCELGKIIGKIIICDLCILDVQIKRKICKLRKCAHDAQHGIQDAYIFKCNAWIICALQNAQYEMYVIKYNAEHDCYVKH